MGKNSSDYFFFFHTYLWVFLPWTIIGLFAFVKGWRQMIRSRFKKTENTDLLTIGGISLIFILISFAQFKLPHYLNITIPLFALLTASYLRRLPGKTDSKIWRYLFGFQIFIASVVILLCLLLCFWVFQLEHMFAFGILIVGILLLIYFAYSRNYIFSRIITVSAGSAVLINAVLNLHFYPSLLEYQAGSTMAGVVKSETIDKENIFKLSERYSWGLDFYNRKPVKIISIDDLDQKKDIWLYVTSRELKNLEEKGYAWDRQYSVDQFRITRLQARFLNPTSRDQVLKEMHLVHLH